MPPIFPQSNRRGNVGAYDYGLGIEPEIVNYIKESNVIQLRISPVHCYLLKQVQTGSAVASAVHPMTINSYSETSPNYVAQIWPSGSVLHPDIRPDINNGSGSVIVKIDGNMATRILDPLDLLNDNEFAVVKRYNATPQRVELVFNEGFNASAHTIQYYYTAMDQNMSPERMKEDEPELASSYGWEQYLNPYVDAFTDPNQILVRMPLTIQNLVINEEGLVLLKENNCWTIWEPYIDNLDVLVVPAMESPTGQELRFEIAEKQDSYIQGTLVSQRFKVKALPLTDKRFQIPYTTE